MEILKYESLIIKALKQSFMCLYCPVPHIHKAEVGRSINSISDQKLLGLQLL